MSGIVASTAVSATSAATTRGLRSTLRYGGRDRISDRQDADPPQGAQRRFGVHEHLAALEGRNA